MIGRRRSRGGAEETIAEFMARRHREAANFGTNAKAAHEDYRKAIPSACDLQLIQPSDVMLYGAHLMQGDAPEPDPQPINRPIHALAGDAPKTEAASTPRSDSVGHPGFLASLIPVWEAGREAVANFQEGNHGTAAIHAGHVASDLALVGSLVRAFAKGGVYGARGAIGEGEAAAECESARAAMGRRGMHEKGQHGHQLFIPQNGWGRPVPNVIKNHPGNIMGMPNPVVHGRIHGPCMKQPQYTMAERHWHGTPTWSIVGTADAPGRAAMGVTGERGRG